MRSERRHPGRMIFASTACVRGPYRCLEEQLADFSAQGVTNIELGWSPRFGGANLTATLRELGHTYLVHNYFPVPDRPFVLNLASQSDDLVARSLSLARSAIQICSDLGAPFYSVHAGFRVDTPPESLGVRIERQHVAPYDDALRTLAESLAELARFGAEQGVQVIVEPNVVERKNLVDGNNELLLMATAAESEALMEAVPGLGILLDLGHLNVTSRTLGFDRAEFVERVSPWVRAFHVHDNDGTADQHLAPEGDSWVFDVLRDRRFAGLPVVLEPLFRDATELASSVRDFSGLLQ